MGRLLVAARKGARARGSGGLLATLGWRAAARAPAATSGSLRRQGGVLRRVHCWRLCAARCMQYVTCGACVSAKRQ
jgi:hypothetical protein